MQKICPFLDPKDGTLYMMGSSMTEPLKKFPFTIPELVAASPSKSAEEIHLTDTYTKSFLCSTSHILPYVKSLF